MNRDDEQFLLQVSAQPNKVYEELSVNVSRIRSRPQHARNRCRS